MPLVESLSTTASHAEATHGPDVDSHRSRFLCMLFEAFDEQDVAHCALHLYDGVLYKSDIAVRPTDREKLPAVFKRLQERGYYPVQLLQMGPGHSRFTFAGVHDVTPDFIAINMFFENVAGVPVVHLVQKRRRDGHSWVADPEHTFSYLVRDAVTRGHASASEQQHVRHLIQHLGTARAIQILSQWVDADASEIVYALEARFNADLLASLHARLRARLGKNRWQRFRSMLVLGQQKLREYIHPNGIFLVFLGPDGVGKTTLIRQVGEGVAPMFSGRSTYRWRPAMFARAPRTVCMPHSKPLRTFRGSIAYLLFAWFDFVAGYLLTIRPKLAQNGLIIFDRYYHDILIDPKRYRYAGPSWLLTMLKMLVPPKEVLFFILDADEHTVLSRKQQLPLQEIRRQRKSYRAFAARTPYSAVITTDKSLESCRAEAIERLFQYLAQRVANRNPRWFVVST